MKTSRIIFLVLIVMLMFGCSSEKHEDYTTSVTVDSDYSILGFKLGMNYAEVQSIIKSFRYSKEFDRECRFVYDEDYRLESLHIPLRFLDIVTNDYQNDQMYTPTNFNIDKYLKKFGIGDEWQKQHEGYYRKGNICLNITFSDVFLYPYIAPFGPIVKGFQLGMPEYEARKIRDENYFTSIKYFDDQFKNTKTIIAIQASGEKLKEIFNVNYVDQSFLEEFMKAYKLEGEEIDFNEFQKRYNYVLHEQARYVEYFPPLKEEVNTYIDCGKFCIVFRPEPGPNVFQIGKDAVFITLVSKKAYRGNRDVTKKNVGNQANFK